MAEIMLALGRNDTRALFNLDNNLVAETYGIKLLDDEIYKLDGHSIVQAAVSRLVRKKGAKTIFSDTKFAIDTPQEMQDGVDKVLGAYTHPPKEHSIRIYTMQPEFMSAVVDLPEIALSAFEKRTIEQGVQPVCHVTSSRLTTADYTNRQTTQEKNAAWKIRLFSESAQTIGSIVCAASDAPIIRTLRPELFIFATGAYMCDEPIEFRHAGSLSLEATVEYANVAIIGSPILSANNPTEELEKRLLAIGK
jgi:hypothetical protein